MMLSDSTKKEPFSFNSTMNSYAETQNKSKNVQKKENTYSEKKVENKKPIENAGYGPFDYGLDASGTKLSSGTVNNINYFNGQKKNVDSGNFNRNIFSYLGA